jgi:low temperature requirement protein LtrA
VTDEAAPRRRRPRIDPEMRESETVKPLELFFDLAFVLVFTQCTALMAADPTWDGIARGMLVLGVLWWAWVGYAWLNSVIDPEEGAVRIVMFAAMAGLLVAALCVPDAFGDRALEFAIAYAVVRFAHIALFVIASREDPELRHSVWGLAISTSIGVGLIVGAALFESPIRELLWVLALALDAGAGLVIDARGWRLNPRHFAERHNLIIILALGESIVALGIGAQIELTTGVIVAAVLGIGLAAALWWIYFDVVSLVTERRLVLAEEGDVLTRNRLARDSYSYLHFPMVAGVVLAALGLEATIAHVDHALPVEEAFALLGGVAIYLLGHVALRWRNAHTLNRQRFALAIVLLALVPAATEVASLTALVVVNVLLWAMIAYETARYDDRRYRLRHGLDPDLDPSPGEERT